MKLNDSIFIIKSLPINVVLPECVAGNVKFSTRQTLNDHLVLFRQGRIVVDTILDALAQIVLGVVIVLLLQTFRFRCIAAHTIQLVHNSFFATRHHSVVVALQLIRRRRRRLRPSRRRLSGAHRGAREREREKRERQPGNNSQRRAFCARHDTTEWHINARSYAQFARKTEESGEPDDLDFAKNGGFSSACGRAFHKIWEELSARQESTIHYQDCYFFFLPIEPAEVQE